jgi:hypothetical protein
MTFTKSLCGAWRPDQLGAFSHDDVREPTGSASLCCSSKLYLCFRGVTPELLPKLSMDLRATRSTVFIVSDMRTASAARTLEWE